MANIPTADHRHVTKKIRMKYENYRQLQKSKCRRSQTQIQKENDFQQSLDDLFDIAHADALNIIRINEDKIFLQAQREKGRRGYMSSIDKEYSKKQSEKRRREEAIEKQIKKEDMRKNLDVSVILSDSSTRNSSSEEDPGTSKMTTKRSRKASEHKSTKIVSQDLVMALDRAKISDRQATIVVAATASSLGHEIDNITLSRSSLRRKRMQIREDIANAIKLSFEPNLPLTVHWDGKFIPDLLNDVDVERLPIIVSGGGKSKLLAVPKLEFGTGENIAKAVIEALDDWGLRNRVRAMCLRDCLKRLL